MKKLFISILSFFFFFLPNNINAQSFGGHPTSVKWNQINTENVRVIFPEGQRDKANRIANIVDYMAQNNLASIGAKTKKLELVLQTNQALSNGYVGLSPYRSEFFATPFQSNQILGAMDWLDVLAIHEYRHALQFTNSNRGFSKFLHFVAGQNGWAAGINLSIPNWFFEGDATMTETALSSVGRGRTPSFFKEQRALLLNGKHYKYMKARNGSYKDLLPNHYPLGYAMMNYGRNNFGPNIWRDVIADAGAYRTVIYPFSGALKKHTGIRSPQLYKATYAELEEQWREELVKIKTIENNVITPKSEKTVSNHRYANYLDDGSLVYIKSSYKETAAIYQLKDGVSQKITDIGFVPEGFLSENNNRLAWTEIAVDPRWGNRNYTSLVTYDLNTNKKKVVKRKTKLFSPEFSSDGKQIAAVQTTSDLKTNILLLNSNTAEVMEQIENSNQDAISFPNWTKDDKDIIYVAKRNSQLAILRYNIAEKTTANLTDWTSNNIGNINVGQNEVIFSASFSGIDNIYSVDLSGNGKIKQLSSVRIGADMPDISPDGKTIVMSEFTDMGNILTTLELSNALNTPADNTAPSDRSRYNISLGDLEGSILESIPNTKPEIKAYHGLLHGIKLHSWGLTADETSSGINLQFANILNDFNANLLASYNTNEEVMQYSGSISYGKYYTPINLGTSIGRRSSRYLNNADTLATDNYTERDFKAGLSLPLSWLRGNFETRLNASLDFVHTRLSEFNDELVNRDRNFNSLQFKFSLSNIRRRAYQNVQTRFGQSISVAFTKGLNGNNVESLTTTGTLYFPGLAANHGIKIEGAYQKELLRNNYQILDGFTYARGYGSRLSDEVSRFSFNYQLPLVYPDWGFGGLTYFKRIRANFFFDIGQTKVNFNNENTTQRSTGLELIFDNTFLNVLPISVGLRQAWLLDAGPGESETRFEVFGAVNL